VSDGVGVTKWVRILCTMSAAVASCWRILSRTPSVFHRRVSPRKANAGPLYARPFSKMPVLAVSAFGMFFGG
jgi:hypothetical protein